MISQPLVSLTCQQGSGIHTAHHGTAGGLFTVTAASGVTGFGQLSITEIGAHSVVTFGAARIDRYGATGLAAGDFLFS